LLRVALLRVALLRIALPQRSKLRSLAPELCCALLCCALLCCALRCSKFRNQAPELVARCFAATQEAPELCYALLCRNATSSGARLRSFAARCVAASSGASFRSLLRVALRQRSKLRNQAPELCYALLCCAWLRSFTARCFAAALELCCALLCCGSGALLRVALLQLNPATQQALERLLQQKKKKNPEPFASSSIFFILLWFS
jgi:hypothetical protein